MTHTDGPRSPGRVIFVTAAGSGIGQATLTRRTARGPRKPDRRCSRPTCGAR
ncbi:hypothetical protein Gobs01_02202 [Geodermatophilus obscurus DSM 43160]|uniref:Uncharacterized protein n=1 Tax=Geodermatophilus obscurus (strain ATCC 25078 / DSM 43160 / JCM 3152 / CCUG 61914 / KCC A-0152 / KCTC 9177 / NBRC 13315 / NRRL B-3577 / G-20) TaxID=526225 RepID=D2SFM8_GEOOG|nr:hypothetical protein Gobs_2097 [Geodermatophilus obscurus DSM 43160]